MDVASNSRRCDQIGTNGHEGLASTGYDREAYPRRFWDES